MQKYSVKNDLNVFVIKEMGQRMEVTGRRVLKRDVLNEIAEHCGVKYDNINRINRNIVTPSLPVALRIANYFSVKVDDIFSIK